MNEYDRKRGHPCDSEEWFFKMLGNPDYYFTWKAPVKENETKLDDGCGDLLGIVQEPTALVI